MRPTIMDEPETQSVGSSSEASIIKDDGLIVVAPAESQELSSAIETPTVTSADPMTVNSTTTTATTDSTANTKTTTSTTNVASITNKTTNVISATNGHSANNNNNNNKNHNSAPWRSYNGPKLYVKPVSRTSNQQIIHKAIAKALEGAANANTLKRVQETIQANIKTCSHFLILFRNYQFKGIYDYNEKLATITKLDGLGPKVICPENIVRFFKFDSTKRAFTEVETKQIGPTIIAISLSTYNPPK